MSFADGDDVDTVRASAGVESAETGYEYGITRSLGAELAEYGEPHRAGMTEDDARQWIVEWLQEGGRDGVFSVVRRPVGRWELVPDVRAEVRKGATNLAQDSQDDDV